MTDYKEIYEHQKLMNRLRQKKHYDKNKEKITQKKKDERAELVRLRTELANLKAGGNIEPPVDLPPRVVFKKTTLPITPNIIEEYKSETEPEPQPPVKTERQYWQTHFPQNVYYCKPSYRNDRFLNPEENYKESMERESWTV